jgi:isopentenyl phosphate kinase
MILIKLGGSVITDKKEYKRFNRDVVSRLCREIKDSGKDVIIVHGGGSFGHVLAKEFELHKGHIRDGQIDAVARVSLDMRELSNMVIRELIDAGIPSASIPTGSCFVMDDNRLLIDTKVLERYLSLGIVPVMFGDVVTDMRKGFGICSGDMIMQLLAKLFSPDMVVFVSDIDGLYDRDPKASKDAKLIVEVTEDLLDKITSEMAVADVTGGIREKMRVMLGMCSDGRDCILVNGTVDGRLNSLLNGMDVICTRARK